LGLDLPAYIAASLFHFIMTWQESCVDAMTTPRGQILCAPFVFSLWWLVGLSIRRFSQRRWRKRTEGRLPRVLLELCLVPAPFALMGILLSVVGAFVSGMGVAFQLAGISVWALYISLLAAERLRVWPLGTIQPVHPSTAES
jgi:hypothetical protein